jgi:prepilin-type N-terminal cleavage/methylation domain-containing protein
VRDGFTLVEVMVAVAIASLLIVGVTASTQATVRTANRQRLDARAEEGRARAAELFGQDWRGRLTASMPRPEPPATLRPLVLSTTADSLRSSGARGARLVSYTVTEKGLFRKEGDTQVLLLPGPLRMDFWDGVAWRPEPGGGRPAVRLRLEDPEEALIFR